MPVNTRFAVLIDADNVPYRNVREMMEEIAKYGTPTTKRIYADWTRPNAAGWKGVLLEHAITPVQQYSYTVGKNSSDSALIIDAMDLLYQGNVDGFCLVSSDSDFTRLAVRLRESGKKTPPSLISACDRFIFIEVLDTTTKKAGKKEAPEKVVPERAQKLDNETLSLIEDTIDDLSDEDGWAFLGDVGNMIVRKKPEFDPRNYGFNKLTPLLKSLKSLLEIDERHSDNRMVKHVYVRLKASQSSR